MAHDQPVEPTFGVLAVSVAAAYAVTALSENTIAGLVTALVVFIGGIKAFEPRTSWRLPLPRVNYWLGRSLTVMVYLAIALPLSVFEDGGWDTPWNAALIAGLGGLWTLWPTTEDDEEEPDEPRRGRARARRDRRRHKARSRAWRRRQKA